MCGGGGASSAGLERLQRYSLDFPPFFCNRSDMFSEKSGGAQSPRMDASLTDPNREHVSSRSQSHVVTCGGPAGGGSAGGTMRRSQGNTRVPWQGPSQVRPCGRSHPQAGPVRPAPAAPANVLLGPCVATRSRRHGPRAMACTGPKGPARPRQPRRAQSALADQAAPGAAKPRGSRAVRTSTSLLSGSKKNRLSCTAKSSRRISRLCPLCARCADLDKQSAHASACASPFGTGHATRRAHTALCGSVRLCAAAPAATCLALRTAAAQPVHGARERATGGCTPPSPPVLAHSGGHTGCAAAGCGVCVRVQETRQAAVQLPERRPIHPQREMPFLCARADERRVPCREAQQCQGRSTVPAPRGSPPQRGARVAAQGGG